jgi:hypothetical protein
VVECLGEDENHAFVEYLQRATSQLTGHDLILVFGAPVFRYHQYLTCPILLRA